MTEDRLVWLIVQKITGDLLPEQVRELADWASESTDNQLFLEKYSDAGNIEIEINLWNKIDPEDAYVKWKSRLLKDRQNRVRRIIGWSVAASLLFVMISMPIQIRRHSFSSVRPIKTDTAAQLVLPGRNTAILTLDDGRQVLLDSMSNGEAGIQGGSKIVKDDSSRLSYKLIGESATSTVYNTLTTPRSGQYHLILADGSGVWLNNASSLRYPTSFEGKRRTVYLTGEAYFEIAKDDFKPFAVEVKDATVQVLGTRFNIMSYDDEGGSQTTLLGGGVAVKTKQKRVIINVDEQAVANDAGGIDVVKNISGDDVISWKDGFFYFNRASFASVMRQLARWYDIEVVYAGNVPDIKFGGKIDRNLSLNDLLKFLDTNQIHFRLEGRKLIVLPAN